jgi:hypothetical protein
LHRKQLGAIFDSTNYSLALGLLALAFYCRYEIEGEEWRSTYYVTLAIEICKNLHCFNSDVYLRSLFCSFCQRRIFNDEVANFQRKLDYALKFAYYPGTVS